MIEQQTIFEIHRMKGLGLSLRAIARNLSLGRRTVVKYLENPNPGKPTIKRASKLDPFKEEIAKVLDMDATVSGQVIRQRLIPLGFDGRPFIAVFSTPSIFLVGPPGNWCTTICSPPSSKGMARSSGTTKPSSPFFARFS